MCFFVNNDKITQKTTVGFCVYFLADEGITGAGCISPKAARALIVGECVILIVCVVGFCVILSLLRKKGYHPQKPRRCCVCGRCCFFGNSENIFFVLFVCVVGFCVIMFCIMKQHEYDELKKRRRYYPKRRSCACGCGRLVYCTGRKGTGRKFALDACRQRDLRARMAAANEWNESRKLSDEQGDSCEECGAAIAAHPRGRRLRFCGGRCQKRAERARTSAAAAATARGRKRRRA